MLQKRRVSCDTALLEMRDQRNANLIRYELTFQVRKLFTLHLIRAHNHKSIHEDIIEAEETSDIL